MTWAVYYSERASNGTPDQIWTANVYLHDRWEVYDTEADAKLAYETLIELDSTHCAGYGPMKRGTDWSG